MDDSAIWLLLPAVLILALMVYEAIRYLFPPRCETCGRRYNHKQHAECPYCVPLRRPSLPDYAGPFLFCAAVVGLGALMGDGSIIGGGVALFFAIFISTQLRIPWDEIWTKRVWLLALGCVAIIVYFASTMPGH